MGLRPLLVAVAAVGVLAVPLLASPKISVSQSPTETELPARAMATGPVPRAPTTVHFPLKSTPTTRTPPPPIIGPTTTTVPKFSGFLAQSVDFVAPDVGFALGYVRCGREICFAFRRTLDRGASWIALPAPPFNVGAPSDRAQFELHFANALDGWAFGATLWATDDGARSWYPVNLGGPVIAMTSGAGEAYAAVQACGPSSVTCNGTGQLWHSSVGTGRWAELQGAPARLDVEGGQFSLVAEGRTVFLAGAYPHSELFVSTDGLPFSSLPVPCSQEAGAGPGPFRPGQLAASSPSDLALTCLGPPTIGAQAIQVFISRNGGLSFRLLRKPEIGQGAEVAMAGPTTLLLGTDGAAGTWLSAPSRRTVRGRRPSRPTTRGPGLQTWPSLTRSTVPSSTAPPRSHSTTSGRTGCRAERST